MLLRFAHFSDLHASEKNKDEALKMLKFIFDTCRERQVHAIFNTGDTWDGPVTLGDHGPVNELFKMLHMCPAPMYTIEGTKSHDQPGSIDSFNNFRPIGSNQYFYTYREPDSFQIVNTGDSSIGGDYMMLGRVHPGWNLDKEDATPCGHLSILPAPTKSWLAKGYEGSPEGLNQYLQQKLRDILTGFGAKAADSPRPHILLSHITVTGSETSTGQTMLGGDIQVSVADLDLANADYIALGHIHKAQQPGLPRHISYAGSPYHVNFGELEPKGFKIVTFEDGKLVDIEFVETPSRPRQVIDIHIVNGELKKPDNICPGADVRMRIYGSLAEIESIKGTTAIESFGVGANSLKIETIPQAENRIRSANITTAKNLREKLIEYGNVKQIKIPESALSKADALEIEVPE